MTSQSAIILGLRYLPISEGSVISMTNPVFAALFSAIILKETFDAIMGFITFLSVLGVIFIAKPDFLFRDSGEIDQDMDAYTRMVGTALIMFSSVTGGLT